MAGVRVHNLSDDFTWGAIVEGVNSDALADDGVRAELNAVYEDRGFILFIGCEPSAQMQVAISNVFGPLKPHPTATAELVDANSAPGVIDIFVPPIADGDDIGTLLLHGQQSACYSPWHFDHAYNNELNRGGVLRAIDTAPERGRTGFVDGVELYHQLSPDLLARIEGRNIIYTFDSRLSKMRFGRPEGLKVFPEDPMLQRYAREGTTFPRAMHPAVWTRRTGEKVLHVGPWMSVGVEHMEDPQGDELLEAVCQEINAKAHAYWHRWKPTDMVIWDNWRMLHAVEGNDPRFGRHMHRTTIKGDYGLGYFEGGKQIGEVQREFVP
jgi:taurine dioxygenase